MTVPIFLRSLSKVLKGFMTVSHKPSSFDQAHGVPPGGGVHSVDPFVPLVWVGLNNERTPKTVVFLFGFPLTCYPALQLVGCRLGSTAAIHPKTLLRTKTRGTRRSLAGDGCLLEARQNGKPTSAPPHSRGTPPNKAPGANSERIWGSMLSRGGRLWP